MKKSTKNQIYNLVRLLLGTTVVGIFIAFLNYQIQNREVEIKELEQLGKFIEHALNENIAVRQRFAVYFATVSRSEKMRDRWKKYKIVVDNEEKETKDRVERLEKEISEIVTPVEERLQKVELELQKLEEQKGLVVFPFLI